MTRSNNPGKCSGWTTCIDVEVVTCITAQYEVHTWNDSWLGLLDGGGKQFRTFSNLSNLLRRGTHTNLNYSGRL